MHLYLLSIRAHHSLQDLKAACELLKEGYTIVRSGLAPFNMGFIYETTEKVTSQHQEVLGIVEWR